MASILNATTSSGLVTSADNSGELRLQTNSGTTAVTVTTAQLVGVGTTTPSARLHVTQSSNPIAQFTRSDSGTGLVIASDSDGPYFRPETSSAIRFNNSANTVENMRIDSSGNLLVGTTTSLASGLTVNGGNGPQLSLNTATRFTQINFYNLGNQKGFIAFDNTDTRLIIQNASAGVYLSSGATSWTSNSDERNKDIIEPITDAVNKVSTLRTVIGKYKSDAEGTRRPFLIAQDVQAVLPEAVEASNPNDLGVNYTDVIPLLTAAIQELNAKVDAQAAEIQALKGVA